MAYVSREYLIINAPERWHIASTTTTMTTRTGLLRLSFPT